MPSTTTTRQLTAPPDVVHDYIVRGLNQDPAHEVIDSGAPIKLRRAKKGKITRKHTTAEVNIIGDRLDITVSGTLHPRVVDAVLGTLPDGALYDHGIPAAKEAMGKGQRLFSSWELENLASEMRHGETVQIIASCQIDGNLGLIIVTDQRILTKDQKSVSAETREILPRHITSVSVGSKLTGDWIKITSSNSDIEVSTLVNGKAVADSIRDLRESDSQPVSPAPQSGVADLEKLAELHAAGVLTDEEFSAAKAKALGI